MPSENNDSNENNYDASDDDDDGIFSREVSQSYEGRRKMLTSTPVAKAVMSVSTTDDNFSRSSNNITYYHGGLFEEPIGFRCFESPLTF